MASDLSPAPAGAAASQEAQWDAVRGLFMNDPGEVYLNTGSWGLLPRSAYETLVAAIRERELNPTRQHALQRERVRGARRRLAAFVGADPADLALLMNVTVAINVVVNGLPWQPGDEILASDQEYGAIDNCLHNAAARWGITVRRAKVPIPPTCPEDVVRAFEAGLTERTRLLLCSHITTGTGLIAPVRALADLAHAHGALIAIDGAHAPGMIPLDLAACGCDFYGGNCHKWLCAPQGVGFLHAAPAVQERLRHLVVGWGYSSDGATASSDGRPLIKGEPYMWGLEQWGTFSMPEQIAMGEAVRLQEEIGPERIAARGRKLAAHLRQRMAAYPWARLISPSHPDMTGSISTFLLDGFGSMKLGEALYDRYRITAPAGPQGPGHRIRVSTHIYNTFDQVDRLVAALEELHAEAARGR